MNKLVLGLSLSTAFFAGSAVTSWTQAWTTAGASEPVAETAAEPSPEPEVASEPEPESTSQPAVTTPAPAKMRHGHKRVKRGGHAKPRAWEYRIMPFASAASRKRFAAKNVTKLNQAGAQGWQLMAVDADNFYLRRAKKRKGK